MSTPHDVRQTLDHCMVTIKGASEAMAEDMLDAAMKLGAASMMLASASHSVHQRAAQLAGVPAQPDTGPEPGP